MGLRAAAASWQLQLMSCFDLHTGRSSLPCMQMQAPRGHMRSWWSVGLVAYQAFRHVHYQALGLATGQAVLRAHHQASRS